MFYEKLKTNTFTLFIIFMGVITASFAQAKIVRYDLVIEKTRLI